MATLFDGAAARALLVLLPLTPAFMAVHLHPQAIPTDSFLLAGAALVAAAIAGWWLAAVVEHAALGFRAGYACAATVSLALLTLGEHNGACAGGALHWTVPVHIIAVGLWALTELAFMWLRGTNRLLVGFNVLVGVVFVTLYFVSTFGPEGCWEEGRRLTGAFELLAVFTTRLNVALTPAKGQQPEPIDWTFVDRLWTEFA